MNKRIVSSLLSLLLPRSGKRRHHGLAYSEANITATILKPAR